VEKEFQALIEDIKRLRSDVRSISEVLKLRDEYVVQLLIERELVILNTRLKEACELLDALIRKNKG